MPRDMDAAMAAGMGAARLTPIGFVELSFGSGVVRLWSGVGTYKWNGYDWKGTGTLGQASGLREMAELRAVGMDLQLSGQDPEIIEKITGESWQGRAAQVWYAVIDDNLALIGEPVRIFKGFMDKMIITEGAKATIQIRLESRSVDMERVRVRRWTAEDQRGEYPGDKGCDAVASLQEVNFVWGS